MADRFLVEGIEHTIGDYTCEACGARRIGYPEVHSCGGVLHHEFKDECPICDFLNYVLKCDLCGYEERSLEDHTHEGEEDAP